MTREEILNEYEEVVFTSCYDCELEPSAKHRLHGGESDGENCDEFCGVCKQFKKRKKEAAVSKCTVKFNLKSNDKSFSEIPVNTYYVAGSDGEERYLHFKGDGFIHNFAKNCIELSDGIVSVTNYQPVDVEIAVRRCEG